MVPAPQGIMKPNLFEYDNYRKFLREYYAFLKGTKRSVSFRYLSKRGGFQSPNFLQMVMDGKRNLTMASIPKVVQAFSLNRAEGDFFENLVLFNQAATTDEKTRFYRRMAKSRGYRQIKQLEQDQFEYFSHWYYPAIRELVTLEGFRSNAAWISEALEPEVPMAKVLKAIEVLKRLKLVEEEKGGSLRAVDRTVTSGNETTSVGVRSFHQQMGNVAISAIDRVPARERDIGGVMFALPASRFHEVKERIQQFRKELLELVDNYSDPKDRLYQLNLHLFPISRKRREKERK